MTSSITLTIWEVLKVRAVGLTSEAEMTEAERLGFPIQKPLDDDRTHKAVIACHNEEEVIKRKKEIDNAIAEAKAAAEAAPTE